MAREREGFTFFVCLVSAEREIKERNAQNVQKQLSNADD